ncbi:hypothetical protein [Sporosarcina sp. FSL K6-3457]|uniref:hypothetical protein n=1 Tax=Sporosarcina sp. FSL K6-3457 TaxID=2978204 RepID=UPI0030F9E458
MQKARYDEFQVAKRHRYGHHAFFLTIALIFVNGFIKMNYIWADPLMEMMVLVYIPLTYITVMSAWKGAYLSRKDKNTYLYIPMFGFVALFNWSIIGYTLWDGMFVLVKDGKLAISSSILFTTIYFTLIVIAMIMRRVADTRIMRAEG